MVVVNLHTIIPISNIVGRRKFIMWPFKKKIKETPKGRLYGNRYNTGKSDFSVWDNMSFIEQIAMILLPCMLCFMFYIMLEMTGLIFLIILLFVLV